MTREEIERIDALDKARTQGEVLAAVVECIPGLTDKPKCADLRRKQMKEDHR